MTPEAPRSQNLKFRYKHIPEIEVIIENTLSLTHAAKCPKGLSCFEKQTAKHFPKLKKI